VPFTARVTFRGHLSITAQHRAADVLILMVTVLLIILIDAQRLKEMKQMVVVHGQMLTATGSQIKMILVLILLELLKIVVVRLSQLI
jgi:hypothetical protein